MCGCTPYWGRNCSQKKSEHKDNATFRNRMGGSDENCIPTRTWLLRGADPYSRFKTWLSKLKEYDSKSLVYHAAPLYFKTRSSIKAKAESGVTCHYFKLAHIRAYLGLRKLKDAPKAMLPNNERIQASHKRIFSCDLALLSSTLSTLVFSGLANKYLIVIGQLCDNNCNALFTTDRVFIIKNKKTLLQSSRNGRDGLWDIDILSKQHLPLLLHRTWLNKINYIIPKDKIKIVLAQYLYPNANSNRPIKR